MKGSVIGYGRTAEIYEWGSDRVLKLFKPGWPTDRAREEARVSRVVQDLGLSVPKIEGVVEIEGRYGIILERIEGPSMLQQFRQKPWRLFQLTRTFAELHVQMHEHSSSELPSQREGLTKLLSSPKVPDEARRLALEALSKLPDGDSVCHGDFHPDEVIVPLVDR